MKMIFRLNLIIFLVFLGVAFFGFKHVKFLENKVENLRIAIENLKNTNSTKQNPIINPMQSENNFDELYGEMTNWKLYINKKYNYSFRYPEGLKYSSNEFATDPEISYSVYTYPETGADLHVEVVEPKNYKKGSDLYNKVLLDLKNYAEEIWHLNTTKANADKIVTPLKLIRFVDKDAYQFSVNHDFRTFAGGYLLKAEYVYIFVENHGIKFMIWFPKENEGAQKILNTFQFLN